MWPFTKTEKRDSIENPSVDVTPERLVSFFGMSATAATGEKVTIESALGIPAVWDAVNFISGTMAGLPLHVYKRTKGGRDRETGSLARVLHDVVNEDLVSSFAWRKQMFEHVLTGGRGFTFIERNAAGRVMNLWPLDPAKVTIKREGHKTVYHFKESERKTHRYDASEIIDVPFMLAADGLGHRSPILTNKDSIGLAQAAVTYGSKFFSNGGVPPFVVTGGFQSGKAMNQAADDLDAAVKKTTKEARQALVLPTGLDIKDLGANPDKAQFVELQRFLIEQIARIYALPPTFLQDLSNGTYSNSEQQDLHFVKHTLRRWVEQFEQELNVKLFGRANARQFVELNVDGILRGDFKTRMEGYSQGVQSGVLKPNEARRMENRPDDPAGDMLMINSASVPIENQINGPKEGAANE